MLRSRANARSQRPSEPTDERSGSNGYYGGYPAHHSPTAVGVGGGSEEGSYGHYGYGHSQQQQPYTDKKNRYAPSKNPFKDQPSKSSNLCSGAIWYCFVLMIVIGLSMDVFAQFRGYKNVTRRLEAVRLHYGEDDSNNNDDTDSSSTTTPFESEPQLELRDIQIKLRSLAESNSQLQQSLSHYTSFTIPKLNSEIQSIQHQLEATTQENSSRSSQLEILRKQRQSRSDEIAELITQFTTQHKSQSGNLLIPQAGSGRTIEVGKEVAQTVEELELYVKEREDVLWEKIDGLMERLKRQSRLEVVEW